MNFLEEAKKEEAILLEKLDVVRNVIRYYGGGEVVPKSLVENNLVFPSKANKEKQVLWLFNNKIKHAIKLKEIQDIYNQHVGSDKVSIDALVRRLRKESKLLFVKYNGKNVLSFWGLPEWVEGDNFKENYAPAEDLLPTIEFSDVIIGEDDLPEV